MQPQIAACFSFDLFESRPDFASQIAQLVAYTAFSARPVLP